MTGSPVPAVAAVVPAWNERTRIGETVEALRSVETIAEVVVIDDASDDGTFDAAMSAGALVYRLSHRSGKGAALAAGVARTPAPILVFIDADLGATAAVAAALVRPVLAGEADMAIVRPPDGAPSGFGLVEGFARWGIRRLTGATMGRPLSGQRALRREIVERFPIAARFGAEVALTVDAMRAGFRVVEVPGHIEHARTGRDAAGFAHRARQGFDVAVALGERAFRRD